MLRLLGMPGRLANLFQFSSLSRSIQQSRHNRTNESREGGNAITNIDESSINTVLQYPSLLFSSLFPLLGGSLGLVDFLQSETVDFTHSIESIQLQPTNHHHHHQLTHTRHTGDSTHSHLIQDCYIGGVESITALLHSTPLYSSRINVISLLVSQSESNQRIHTRISYPFSCSDKLSPYCYVRLYKYQ